MLDYLRSRFPRQGEKPKVVLAPAKDQNAVDVFQIYWIKMLLLKKLLSLLHC
ncbi:MAG: hypothetical protein XD84_1294 [Desulfotomaculum sp. 46_80]|nr:MAG: hypothetical protein XD84_1294 [Desulfotomaculum sp. 46_80]